MRRTGPCLITPTLPPTPAGLSHQQLKRRHIVAAIIHSENSYVATLQRLVNVRFMFLFIFVISFHFILLLYPHNENSKKIDGTNKHFLKRIGKLSHITYSNSFRFRNRQNRGATHSVNYSSFLLNDLRDLLTLLLLYSRFPFFQ